jgi:hypothetical protein
MTYRFEVCTILMQGFERERDFVLYECSLAFVMGRVCGYRANVCTSKMTTGSPVTPASVPGRFYFLYKSHAVYARFHVNWHQWSTRWSSAARAG